MFTGLCAFPLTPLHQQTIDKKRLFVFLLVLPMPESTPWAS